MYRPEGTRCSAAFRFARQLLSAVAVRLSFYPLRVCSRDNALVAEIKHARKWNPNLVDFPNGVYLESSHTP